MLLLLQMLLLLLLLLLVAGVWRQHLAWRLFIACCQALLTCRPLANGVPLVAATAATHVWPLHALFTVTLGGGKRPTVR